MTNGTKKLYLKLKYDFNNLSNIFYYLEMNKIWSIAKIKNYEDIIKTAIIYRVKESEEEITSIIKKTKERIKYIDLLTSDLDKLNFNYTIERMDDITIDQIYNILKAIND